MSADVLVPAGEATMRLRARCHPLLIYKDLRVEFDCFDQGGLVLHTICPRCTKFGLLTHANKHFEIDEQGRLTILEPFRCDYCLARFRVTDGVMQDAPAGEP